MTERITVFTGPASARLGFEVCEILRVDQGRYGCDRFPDGEIQMDVLETVRGRQVYIVQSTSPPVEGRLMELLLLADACRRAGAARLTGVIPYFGYARQDKRDARRSLGARVAADAISTGRFDRLMLIDAHTPAIEGFFSTPIDHLTALPLLAKAAAPIVRDNTVVVAPDLGAVKRARQFARRLQVPMAFVHKTRLDGDQVAAHEIIGEVRGRLPLVVDDMLTTGGTVKAAVEALRAAGAAEPVAVVVTHALLVGRAREILAALPLSHLIATDTVAIEAPAPHLEVTSIAPLLATAIRRDYRDESLSDLRLRG